MSWKSHYEAVRTWSDKELERHARRILALPKSDAEAMRWARPISDEMGRRRRARKMGTIEEAAGGR